jgi:acetyl-CoA C-acetyltransferase
MDPETAMKTGFMPQGIGADLIATLDGFTREQVDTYAAGSHRKAAAAWARGAFAKSVIPVKDRNGITILDRDETIRPDSTPESLAKLPSSFQFMGDLGFDGVPRNKYPQVERISHIHTAGNSSGIVDGAALVLIGSESAGKQLGLKPRARVIGTAVVGTDPTIMLVGPAPATRKALKVAGLGFDDIDLFEVPPAGRHGRDADRRRARRTRGPRRPLRGGHRLRGRRHGHRHRHRTPLKNRSTGKQHT